MHAKMTRDRKKCFFSAIEQTIRDLTMDIERMRNVLANVSGIPHSNSINYTTGETDSRTSSFITPELTSSKELDSDFDNQRNEGDVSKQDSQLGRSCHELFSLND
jgi:hypothetical protein